MATALAPPCLPARPSRSPASRPADQPPRQAAAQPPARPLPASKSPGRPKKQRRRPGAAARPRPLPIPWTSRFLWTSRRSRSPRRRTTPLRPAARSATSLRHSRYRPRQPFATLAHCTIGICTRHRSPALLTAKRREGHGRYMLERPDESGHPEPMTGKRLPPVSARLPATPIRQTLAACGSRTPSTSHSVTAHPPLDAP